MHHACKRMYILGYSFYCMLDKVLLLVRCDLKVLFSVLILCTIAIAIVYIAIAIAIAIYTILVLKINMVLVSCQFSRYIGHSSGL